MIKLTDPQRTFLLDLDISNGRAAYNVVNAKRRMADRLIKLGLATCNWSLTWSRDEYRITNSGRAALNSKPD